MVKKSMTRKRGAKAKKAVREEEIEVEATCAE
jgi:hypothetical protein